MRTRRPTPSVGMPEASRRHAVEAARTALAHRSPEALLLLQLLIEDCGDDGPRLMRRLAGQLRLCADLPELAEGAGCPARTLDRGLTRAAADLLAEAARAA